MRRPRRLGAAALAVAAGALALGVAPAGGQGGGEAGDEGGDGEGGPARTVTWEPRVVDLAVRVEATDGSESSEETPEQRTVTFASDVLFDFDRSDLNAEARERIDDLAGELDDLGPRAITIEGHTDDQGDPAYNQGLSERRAFAVEDRLAVALGEGFTFETVGYGETRPAVPNQREDGTDDPEAQARNRRVVVAFPTD